MTETKEENWEYVEIEKLKIDNNNPNQMSNTQLEALKKNIQKFGWNMPIITDMEYLIADGEQKLQAAKELQLKRVPILRKKLTNAQRLIVRQSMNKLRGKHDIDLDAAEFKRILEKTDMEEFTSLVGLGEQEVLNTLERTDREEKEVAEEVDQLGSLTITCPKCHHVFKKKKEAN